MRHDHHLTSHDRRTHLSFENVQIRKKLHLRAHELWNTQLPHWIMMISSHACFPCETGNPAEVFCWWPYTDYIWPVTKSLAHSSTRECLNVQAQVSSFKQTGSIGKLKCPRWKEERRKARMKSQAWFISKTMLISRMLPGSPSLSPHSAISRCTIWEPLWASALLKK